jgi:hypothetical protein
VIITEDSINKTKLLWLIVGGALILSFAACSSGANLGNGFKTETTCQTVSESITYVAEQDIKKGKEQEGFNVTNVTAIEEISRSKERLECTAIVTHPPSAAAKHWGYRSSFPNSRVFFGLWTDSDGTFFQYRRGDFVH